MNDRQEEVNQSDLLSSVVLITDQLPLYRQRGGLAHCVITTWEESYSKKKRIPCETDISFPCQNEYKSDSILCVYFVYFLVASSEVPGCDDWQKVFPGPVFLLIGS